MLSAGAGRGRGWMKLEKNTEPCRPGDEFKKLESSSSHFAVPKKKSYDDLVKQFECLNSDDDGILLNEKLKHIRSVFMNACETEEEIRNAMIAIHQKCVTNGEFMKKFISFITSAFFYNMQSSKSHMNWKTIVQKCFFDQLQANFEHRDRLRELRPEVFYNNLELHMNFFRRCRIIHPYGYPSVETAAVSGFLQTLLEYREPSDIKMFFYLICENPEIIISLNDNNELLGLLNKLKMCLVCSDNLPPNDRAVLFFSWDLIHKKFELSSEELQFYERLMDKEYFREISIKYSYLFGRTKTEVVNEPKIEKQLNDSSSIGNHSMSSHNSSSTGHRLHDSNTVDQYPHSSTSVNNSMCNDEDGSGKPQISNFQTSVSNYDITSSKNDSWEFGDGGRTDNSNMNRQKGMPNEKSHNTDKHKPAEKVGRPILGIGARLKRNC
ncbi:hypothetical protein WA026_011752 [Henosepilachna vigintioctopunctata]|uniref:Uncharacterized protein n=1 Tax=Henosepilachna vigintioctopunctata TaxID=420089 RepID=A0AAW1UH38_9CUCU